jgi:hypothetical protein
MSIADAKPIAARAGQIEFDGVVDHFIQAPILS